MARKAPELSALVVGRLKEPGHYAVGGVNCNRSKRKYRYCGIGTVHETEADSMRGLLMALTYITKSDQYVSIRDVKVRCFGHWVEKPRTTKRGRPRTRTARDERAQFTTDPMALAW